MSRSLFSLLLAACGLGLSQTASAAAVPGYACNGCSLAQEEQAALARPGLGLRFVYNFISNRLRKFLVVLDSAGAVDGVLISREPRDYTKASPSGRELYEMAVDAGMVPIFATAANLWRKDPSWFTSKVQRIGLDRVGLTQGDITVREYSPRDIAWSGPNSGEGLNFIDRLNFLLDGPYGTSQLSPELSQLIHGIGFAMQTVTIEGSSGAELTIGTTWGGTPPKEITLDFCNSRNECVRVKINTSQPLKVEVVGARDAFDQEYPFRQERDVDRDYPARGREAAGDMGRYISGRRQGTFIGGNLAPNCGRIGLACTDIGTSYRCETFCIR